MEESKTRPEKWRALEMLSIAKLIKNQGTFVSVFEFNVEFTLYLAF